MEFELQNQPRANTDSTPIPTAELEAAAAASQFELHGHGPVGGGTEIINTESSNNVAPDGTASSDSAMGTIGGQALSLTRSRPSTNMLITNFNLRSPAVKRLLREAQELSREQPNPDFYAIPLEENLFEWHFTIRGPSDSEFSQGVYHGRIVMPTDYPMKPPSIMILTPNGRFETGVKICLSISSYHEETWRPSWSIRTALVALISFMATASPGAIGSLECTPDVRRALARKSVVWECSSCGPIIYHISHPKWNCPANAQRAFRIPHANEIDELNDPAEFPENATDDEEFYLAHPEAGDTGDWVDAIPAGNRVADNDMVDLPTVLIGCILFGIAGLLCRRFLDASVSYWGWDVFEF